MQKQRGDGLERNEAVKDYDLRRWSKKQKAAKDQLEMTIKAAEEEARAKGQRQG